MNSNDSRQGNFDAPGRDDYLWDGSGRADADVVHLEEVLRPLRYEDEQDGPATWKEGNSVEQVATWLIAIAATLLLGLWLGPRLLGGSGTESTSGRSWTVRSTAGVPLLRDDSLESEGKLHVGNWLETNSTARAQIEVADIGTIDVDPLSRVRLVRTEEREHRIELRHGRISARVAAPKRLFVVDTPSATATDLGCAYTLEVTPEGDARLHVTSGWVEFEALGLRSTVPAGVACQTRSGFAPGTPYRADAPPHFVTRLEQFDFPDRGAKPSIAPLLQLVTDADTITLWHLIPRVAASERANVIQRLAAAAPPPDGVTAKGVLELDHEMLEAWWDELELDWIR